MALTIQHSSQWNGKAADGVHDVSAFHGYWPTEPRGIEPKLGTAEELHALVEAAHERDIRVMMDFVVNHVHEQHTYYEDNPEWFNAGCICGSANCDWTEHRLDCQFTSYMPDVNWKIRDASEQFIDDALWWLETYDLDGLRIDAVKHVEDLATRNLVAQVNERFETVGTDYYLKGETAMGWAGHSLVDNQEQYGTINAYMGPDGLDGKQTSCCIMPLLTTCSFQAMRTTCISIIGPTEVRISTSMVRSWCPMSVVMTFLD